VGDTPATRQSPKGVHLQSSVVWAKALGTTCGDADLACGTCGLDCINSIFDQASDKLILESLVWV
jgi:hypothetical protein